MAWSEKYIRVFKRRIYVDGYGTEYSGHQDGGWNGEGCMPGYDAMNWSEVVGSIAGDDTIMCAIRTTEDTPKVMDKIRKIVRQEE